MDDKHQRDPRQGARDPAFPLSAETLLNDADPPPLSEVLRQHTTPAGEARPKSGNESESRKER